jgi:transposase InsO family protein
MGIRDRPTSPRSPWQNGYAERLIGSIRRECLDHVVVFSERHLRPPDLIYDRHNGNRSLFCRRHGVLLVLAPLASLSLAGQEHSRTIPL